MFHQECIVCAFFRLPRHQYTTFSNSLYICINSLYCCILSNNPNPIYGKRFHYKTFDFSWTILNISFYNLYCRPASKLCFAPTLIWPTLHYFLDPHTWKTTILPHVLCFCSRKSHLVFFHVVLVKEEPSFFPWISIKYTVNWTF